MLTPLRPLLRAGLFLGVFTLWTHSATAQTAHCFNDLSGPEVPCTARSGGGYVSPAPVYRPPSPAELARRRRLAAAHAANERGLKAYKRGDYRTALPYFEKARQLSPNDSTIQSNYWATKGAISYWKESDYGQAITYLRNAIHYNRRNNYLKKLLNTALMDNAVGKANKARDDGQYDTAIKYLAAAKRSCTQSQAPSWFCKGLISDWSSVGIALRNQDWASAGEQLRRIQKAKLARNKSPLSPEEQTFIGIEKNAISAVEVGALGIALQRYEKMGEYEKKWAAEKKEKYKDSIILRMVRLEARRQQASNPPKSPALHDSVSDNQGNSRLPPTGSPQRAPQASRQGNVGSSGPNNFFGDKVTKNPPLAPAATRSSGSGPSAAAQADSARRTAATGATYDGRRGTPAGDASITFVKSDSGKPAEPRVWQADQLQILEKTERGRQIVKQDQEQRHALQISRDAIEHLESEYSKTTDASQKSKLLTDLTNELNKQTEINTKLTNMEKEAGQIITRVELNKN